MTIRVASLATAQRPEPYQAQTAARVLVDSEESPHAFVLDPPFSALPQVSGSPAGGSDTFTRVCHCGLRFA